MSVLLEEQRGWRASDAVRILIIASLPLAWLVAGPVSAAVMLLVLGGAVATRLTQVPSGVDTAAQCVLLAAAWFATLGAYEAVSWLDLATHFASGAVLALLARAMLLRADMLPHGPTRHEAAARMLHPIAAVALLGVVWEIAEWAGHMWVSSEINVGYNDTVTDLIADLLGAIASAVAAELVERRRGAR